MRFPCGNAVDHAIEPPDIRRSKSKPAAGSVRLILEAAGGGLNVTVEDDGKGLDIAGISRVAEGQGLAAGGSPELLIFQPGFTTAGSVTDLSGRGMGLSVAWEAVMRLQGRIDVSRNASGGTTFSISTPLAISSQHLLLVNCSGQTFAIPVRLVERLTRADSRRDFETVEGKRFFSKDGASLPVILLAHLLDLEPVKAKEHRLVAVVNVHGRRFALIVDAFLSERQAVVQNLGDSAVFGTRVSGAVLLEDGSVAPVLNLAGMLASAEAQPPRREESVPDKSPERAASRILVVDDSMTTRTLEKNILESQGFHVTVSV
ncbi:MAG: chemotaxis protein CheW, partial [Acidobacteriota bacterium]